MIQITGLTSSPSQTFNIPEPTTRENIYFSLRFMPRTQNWYIDFQYKEFSAKGIKVVRGPNIIKRNINVLPFGITVSVSDDLEPFLINDFVSGRVSLFLLTQEECLVMDEMIISGAIIP